MSEKESKKRESICIALPPAQASILRQMSAQTKISQADLRKHLEGSRRVGDAMTQALRERYTAWKEEQAKADLFAGLDREKGGDGG